MLPQYSSSSTSSSSSLFGNPSSDPTSLPGSYTNNPNNNNPIISASSTLELSSNLPTVTTSSNILNTSPNNSFLNNMNTSTISPTSASSSSASSSSLRRDALSHVTWLEATVFVGRLPRRTDMQDIYHFFSTVGTIQAIIPSRDTYLFIEYTHPDIASQATQILNGQLFGGSRIVVQPANTLTKLFIGNIDKTLDAKTIHDAIYNIEAGLTSVELFEMSGAEAVLATMQNPSQLYNQNGNNGESMIYTKNTDFSSLTLQAPGTLLHRGFCFAEFSDHAAAHRALTILMHPNFSLSNTKMITNDGIITNTNTNTINELRVDWAEPLHEVSQAVMDTVRILYVSNLPPNYNDASEDFLTFLFSSHTESGAGVERVKRIKNYAFIHFRSRIEAEQAMNALQNYYIVGHAIKIQWSKPPPKTVRNSPNDLPIMNNNNPMLMMNQFNNNNNSSMDNMYNQQQFMNNNNNHSPTSMNNQYFLQQQQLQLQQQRRMMNNNNGMMNNSNLMMNNSNLMNNNNNHAYSNRLQKALSAGMEAAASFSNNNSNNNSSNNNNIIPSLSPNLSNDNIERLAYERGLIDGINTIQIANNNNSLGTVVKDTSVNSTTNNNNNNSFINSLLPNDNTNDINISSNNISSIVGLNTTNGLNDIPTIDTSMNNTITNGMNNNFSSSSSSTVMNNVVPFLRSDRNLSNGSTSSPLSILSSASSVIPSPVFNTSIDHRKNSNGTLDNTMTNDSVRTARTSSSATALSTGSNSKGNNNSLLVTSTRVTRVSDPPSPAPAPSSNSLSNNNNNNLSSLPSRIPAHPLINNNFNNNNRLPIVTNNNNRSPGQYNTNSGNNNISPINNNNNPRLQAQLHAQALGYGDMNNLLINNNNNHNNGHNNNTNYSVSNNRMVSPSNYQQQQIMNNMNNNNFYIAT